MQFKPFKVLNMTLPEIKTAGQNRMDESPFDCLRCGRKIYFNGARVSVDQLSEALDQAKDLPVEPTVLIMADERIELKQIIEVMDIWFVVSLKRFKPQSR